VSDFSCLCVECGGSGREIDRARDILRPVVAKK
jgi:hypothetical protein